MSVKSGNKQNGRRSGNKLKQAKYSGHKTKLMKKKDRHVAKSSHGKYKTVQDLVSHQKAVSPPPFIPAREHQTA